MTELPDFLLRWGFPVVLISLLVVMRRVHRIRLSAEELDDLQRHLDDLNLALDIERARWNGLPHSYSVKNHPAPLQYAKQVADVYANSANHDAIDGELFGLEAHIAKMDGTLYPKRRTLWERTKHIVRELS